MTLRAGGAGGVEDAKAGSGGAFVLRLGTGGISSGGGGGLASGGGGGSGGSGGDALSRGGSDGHADDAGVSSSVDALCLDIGDDSWNDLWDQIERGAAAFGFCWQTTDGGRIGSRQGKLVFDGEGRIVENTGIGDRARRQAWLASLSCTRWPSLAGQELAYVCFVE